VTVVFQHFTRPRTLLREEIIQGRVRNGMLQNNINRNAMIFLACQSTSPFNNSEMGFSYLVYTCTEGRKFATIRPRLFGGWTTLSTGRIAIQWILNSKRNHPIRWIVIYPADSVIRLSNNPGQVNKCGI